ncbi:bifunctional alpha,alpha-trehalose-phosphate synthase (UDP-forming)/trehalose-phosphatase [Leptospira ilyithenensis]|uniref:Bifunctional alpha,alpha-trehalose-phosphate synthase (UDP-forming)/trehalose-phosphatase n=1 Tax=Leptospira ilyithenensis TaxID=2484901 RepID=A0A4V3JWZ4_9LEPT|nr:bifunctional alpha,alpha-trehalose-phosphate synthase (UDP-forming)/trehalose-phosphatase [Leptospira ilyithenensis]TGN10061.1 bifunctional alpha,alpha-trehalose-phosphate synthase (UDP-forming)/trehalose-phosphatase [Leptospira ilyithenensis]
MRLILVSNRLPVTPQGKPTIGGLATGLSRFLDHWKKSGNESLWVGWPGPIDSEDGKSELEKKLRTEHNAIPVFIKQKLFDQFYNGFCNDTLWPLFHYFTSLTQITRDSFESYKEVNQIYADKVAGIYEDGDWIWVHDYHLMLLPAILRKKFPKAKISFFLHIPFPTFEIFRFLSTQIRSSILQGLLGSDLIGFHTQLYTQYFLRSVLRILGIENNFGIIPVEGRSVIAGSYPMGIDYNRFSDFANTAACKRKTFKIKTDKMKIILSVDRLDYSKGVLQRLVAFDLFLKQNPEWREKCKFILIIVPSRTGIRSYSEMKRAIDEKVGLINGDYGNLNWSPIIYQYKGFSFEDLVSYYNASDTILVTPFRDGMNLIAKEFIASQTETNGILILSETAGASSELGEAILVNPNDVQEIADGIRIALTMPEAERQKRNSFLKKRIHKYNINYWASEILKDTNKSISNKTYSKTTTLQKDDWKKIISDCNSKAKTIFFLDYDGTLRELQRKPEDAYPTEEILNLLQTLAKEDKFEIVIISGRTKTFLESYFNELPIHLIAEHGVWWKQPNENWVSQFQSQSLWKEEIKHLLDEYEARVPGSFVEEKDFSLVWHYRNADPEAGLKYSKELLDELFQISVNSGFIVLPGSKIIEIREFGTGKGRIVNVFLESKNDVSVIAIGDDTTDEEMFQSLPESSITIKVGLGDSFAKYRLAHPEEVRDFLKMFV